MRVLLDECVDQRLAGHIVGHDVKTVPEAGCSGPANNQPAISGLGVDPAGDVYAVDACDNAVEKHGPSGSLLARWTREEPITDVAADAAGNVFVLTSSHIWKYAPNVSTATPSASWGQIKARWSNR